MTRSDEVSEPPPPSASDPGDQAETAAETPDEADESAASSPSEDPPESAPESAPESGGSVAIGDGMRPITGKWQSRLLAIVSGFLVIVSFPGWDIWWLSFVALVPLLYAIRGQAPGRATSLCWLTGFVATSGGFYWLVEMLETFSGFPIAVCVLFAAILNGYQAGRYALMGWLYGRATARRWPSAAVFIGAFAVSELTYPLLFPWYFGAGVHNFPILMQTSDLGGPILVGIVLVAGNVAIAEALERVRGLVPDRRVMIAGAVTVALAAVYGVVRLSSVDAAIAKAEPVRVGMVQPDSPLIGKRRSARKVHLSMMRELKKKKVDLAVWSEAAVSGGFIDGKHPVMVKRALGRHLLGIPTVIGSVLYKPLPGKDPRGRRQYKFFNVALMADEKGNIVGRYDKRYLLMFGEYLPLGETFPILYQYSPNSGRFSRGTSLKPLEWKGHRLSTMICYEDILPDFVNDLVAEGDPDLLVNLTNDKWFGNSTEPWIHLALAKFRAVEHRRYLVRVTNSGVSAIVDAAGRVVVHGGVFKQEAIVGEARFMRSKTVYESVGDIPWWLTTVAMLALAFVNRRRPR